MIINKKNMRH